MEDEMAVRVVLSTLKESSTKILTSNQVRNLNAKLNEKLFSTDSKKIKRFNSSEILDKSVATSKIALKDLKKEYKANGVDFFTI
ncbi:hypothetical protein [Enterococcus faecalis]|uniref:hypothetical protein n=1 Tax=Enterococcus faecalis TaxID=1351 RepID=UPI0035F070D4